MKCVQPAGHPPPQGHYSPALVHEGIVYGSGQLPIDAAGQICGQSIEEQTRYCLQKVEEILRACGSRLDLILKVHVSLSGVALWPRFNRAYAELMGCHRPARVVIPCSPLHYGCAVEIDCIAAVAEG